MSVSQEEAFREYEPIAEAVARYLTRRYARWFGASCDFEDLEQLARLGLLQALAQYNRKRSENLPVFLRARTRQFVLDELRRLHLLPRNNQRAAKCHTVYEHSFLSVPDLHDFRLAELGHYTAPDYTEMIDLWKLRQVVERLKRELTPLQNRVLGALLGGESLYLLAKQLDRSDAQLSIVKKTVIRHLRERFMRRAA